MDSETPPKPFALRAIQVILIATGTIFVAPILLMIVAIFVFALLWEQEELRPTPADIRAFEAISLGEPWAKVKTAFDRPPDYRCRFEEFTVHYFLHPTIPDSELTRSYYPDRVTSSGTLPYPPGSIQVLTDTNDIVIAACYSSDKREIRTVNGIYRGSSVANLPHEFFESLRRLNE